MKFLKRAGRFLCSMKCALVLLLVLAAACTAGSVVPQGQAAEWYTANYPQQLAGAILLFGLDDLFHCAWFIILTLFLCVNLLCCNVLRFPALLRRMRTGFTPVRFLASWDGAVAAELSEDPETLFRQMGFRRVTRGKVAAAPLRDAALQEEAENDAEMQWESCYAARNRIGIWGAWLCHFGMLIVIAGFGLGQMWKVEYTVYGVPGQTKAVGDSGYQLTIDSFDVKLREDATVEQYVSGITLTDGDGQVVASGETGVNSPLSMAGMRFYQNSTGWAATVEVRKDGRTLQETLLCAGEYALVEDVEGLAVELNAFYPDYYEDETTGPMTLTPQLRNPGYLYTLYYHDQILGMNVLTGDDVITVEDYEIIFRDPQQYTLIQVKRDPFTPLAALGAMIVLAALLLAFYVRPQELFAVSCGDGTWKIAGKSQKAGLMFAEEIARAAEKRKRTEA